MAIQIRLGGPQKETLKKKFSTSSVIFQLASKLFGVNATIIIIFVSLLYCSSFNLTNVFFKSERWLNYEMVISLFAEAMNEH